MIPEHQFWTYVLENELGRFYIGSTDNLDRRLAQHNDTFQPGSKYAPKHGPWRLVWTELHPSRASAVTRERQIKAMKSAVWIRKNLLVDQDRSVGRANPDKSGLTARS